MISSLICAYICRILERPLSEVSGQNFHELWSSIWVVFVTMTTVGYGDIYPKSYGGRLLGAFMCLWGVLVVSLFVVTISETLEFNHAEKNSYILIKRLKYRDTLRKSAAKFIDSAYHMKLLNRHLKNSMSGNPFLDSASDRNRKHAADFRFRREMLSFRAVANGARQFEDKNSFEDIGVWMENIMEKHK